MCPAGCYIRIGSSKEQMTTEMIDNLYAKRVRNSLNKIESPRQDLTFKQLKIYYPFLEDISIIAQNPLRRRRRGFFSEICDERERKKENAPVCFGAGLECCTGAI